MRSSARLLWITVLLAVLGAAFGALAGALIAVALTTLDGLSRVALDPEFLQIGASFGAPLGALLFPVAGLALMRHVALGRALLGTVLGTVVGGVICWVWPPLGDRLSAMVGGSVVGFVLAVLVLRRLGASESARAVKEPQSAA